MGKIMLMDKALSELIAAGEVVERPASIVKELIENSIDAGAKRITVEIKDGGTTFIRITDDGSGIEPQDVPTAFLRHATSKIKTKADLDNISTMGFRGEALAAVCAVSKVEVMTCTDDAQYGVHYVIHASKEIENTQTGCPKGTTVIVRDLFYNTPARLKFLKKNVTEGNAVEQIVEKNALMHPEISFRFIRDGETKIMTPGDFNPISAIYSVYGKPFANSLTPVDYTYNSMRVSGYVGKPEASKQNRTYQNFYVNSRYIRSTLCSAALEEGCKGKTMVGKFPVCILNIEMPFEAVDVNVHPAKTEVRFHNERDIFHLIYYAVKSALDDTSDSVFSSDTNTQNVLKKTYTLQKPIYFAEKPTQGSQLKFKENVTAEYIQPKPQSSKIITREQEKPVVLKNETNQNSYITAFSAKNEKAENTNTEEKPNSLFKNIADNRQSFAQTVSEPKVLKEQDNMPPVKKEPVYIAEENKETDVDLKYIGEAFGTYILFQSDDTLFFADKHAAHERILYEKIKASHRDSQRQLLLSPVFISLTHEEYRVAVENLDKIAEVGFLAEDFGTDTIAVREVPLWTPFDAVEECVIEIINNISSYKENLTPQRLEGLFESMACRAAIKAGDFSSERELRALLTILSQERQLKNCPHGRPIFVQLKKREIEKMFGRLG